MIRNFNVSFLAKVTSGPSIAHARAEAAEKYDVRHAKSGHVAWLELMKFPFTQKMKRVFFGFVLFFLPKTTES